MGSITSKSVMTNFIWRFMESCGAKFVSFIVSLVLARLLAPEVYGTISLVLIIITILDVFVDSGLGNALIQKKNADDLDFSTVFFFNFFFSLILYIVVFLAAPVIAEFYHDGMLVSIIRVLGLHIVIAGVKNVQYAYVSRTMQFKRFFFATLGGTVGAALIGILFAFLGYGVWALVAQHLFNSVMDMIILWITVKWRPKRAFSFSRLKSLFSFGWKLLASSLLETVYQNLTQLIIGRMYSSADLAYYNRGNQFPSLIVLNVNTSIDSVLMPAMSSEQDNVERVKNMTRRAVKTSTYIMAPLMVGLACCATPLIRLLLTDKWLQCVPYLQIFCIIYLIYPIHTANLNAIKAMGRSDLFLKMEIIKKIVGIVILLITMWHGTLAMAEGMLIGSFFSILINSWPNRKLLGYGYKEQIKDIMPEIVLVAFMGFIVSLVGMITFSDIVRLLLQVLAGAVVYIGGSFILKLDSFMYIWKMLVPYIHKKDIR